MYYQKFKEGKLTRKVGSIIKRGDKYLTIIREGKRAMFAGGSVEDGETSRQAIVREVLEETGAKVVALTAENPDMITESIKDMPLRSFSGFTGGILSQKSVDGLLDLCNGKKGGFKKLVKGFGSGNKGGSFI